MKKINEMMLERTKDYQKQISREGEGNKASRYFPQPYPFPPFTLQKRN